MTTEKLSVINTKTPPSLQITRYKQMKEEIRNINRTLKQLRQYRKDDLREIRELMRRKLKLQGKK